MQVYKYFFSILFSVIFLITGQRNILAVTKSIKSTNQNYISKSAIIKFIDNISEGIENETDFCFDEKIDSDDDNSICLNYFVPTLNCSHFDSNVLNHKRCYKSSNHFSHEKLRKYILFCSLKLDFQSRA